MSSKLDSPSALNQIPELNLNPTPQERAAVRARLIEGADRSFVDDRMTVDLPSDVHGEWVGVDDFSQYNAQQAGFIDGTSYINKNKFLHQHVEGGRIGDVKFMVKPKWLYDEQENVRKEINARKHSLKSDSISNALANQFRRAGMNPDGEKSEGYQISGDDLAKILS